MRGKLLRGRKEVVAHHVFFIMVWMMVGFLLVLVSGYPRVETGFLPSFLFALGLILIVAGINTQLAAEIRGEKSMVGQRKLFRLYVVFLSVGLTGMILGVFFLLMSPSAITTASTIYMGVLVSFFLHTSMGWFLIFRRLPNGRRSFYKGVVMNVIFLLLITAEWYILK